MFNKPEDTTSENPAVAKANMFADVKQMVMQLPPVATTALWIDYIDRSCKEEQVYREIARLNKDFDKLQNSLSSNKPSLFNFRGRE
jgi:hypothetical protein